MFKEAIYYRVFSRNGTNFVEVMYANPGLNYDIKKEYPYSEELILKIESEMLKIIRVDLISGSPSKLAIRYSDGKLTLDDSKELREWCNRIYNKQNNCNVNLFARYVSPVPNSNNTISNTQLANSSDEAYFNSMLTNMSAEELEKIHRMINCFESNKWDTKNIELRKYILREIPKIDMHIIACLCSLLNRSKIKNFDDIRRVALCLERADQNRVEYYVEPNYNLYARRDEKSLTNTSFRVGTIIEIILEKYPGHPNTDRVLTMISRRMNPDMLYLLQCLIEDVPDFIDNTNLLQTSDEKICKYETRPYNIPTSFINYLQTIRNSYVEIHNKAQAQKAEYDSRQKLVKDINSLFNKTGQK